jgi:hypothetical protein
VTEPADPVAPDGYQAVFFGEAGDHETAAGIGEGAGGNDGVRGQRGAIRHFWALLDTFGRSYGQFYMRQWNCCKFWLVDNTYN